MRASRRVAVALLVTALLLAALLWSGPGAAAATTPAFWGFEGHRVVCEIAWNRLDPAGRALVRSLRDTRYPTFANSCSWADEILQGVPAHPTRAYHFINLPAGRTGVDMTRDCPAPARCTPWAIRYYAERLANPSLGGTRRAEALKFLGHFVGDLHQPLHAGHPAVPGRPGNDRGGNWVQAQLRGSSVANLHSIWDGEIMRRAGITLAGAQGLSSQVTPAEATAWSNLDVVGWANESYQLADTLAYGRTRPAVRGDENFGNPSAGTPGPGYNIIRDLDPPYEAAAAGAIRQRLKQGGVRLAYLINRAAANDLAFPSPPFP